MAETRKVMDGELKARVLALLEENQVMTLATVRPDGWPQATMVGYVNDGLDVYFAVARSSQKFANIERDSRVSIAVGRSTLTRIRGLSMAARAAAVSDPEEVARVNALIAARHPEQWVFAPREDFAVVMRATPRIISVIDLGKDTGKPELVEVSVETTLHRL
jgi:nitroimidazol reductase NimA-like FMN-containing flavoprotein (pyridoxamine 5'-phosphate oxidase superfamily)